MKILWGLVPTVLRSILTTIAFLVGIGWTAFLSVNSLVKAEGKAIRMEVKEIRNIDMEHLNKRFDRLEVLIEKKE